MHLSSYLRIPKIILLIDLLSESSCFPLCVFIWGMVIKVPNSRAQTNKVLLSVVALFGFLIKRPKKPLVVANSR